MVVAGRSLLGQRVRLMVRSNVNAFTTAQTPCLLLCRANDTPLKIPRPAIPSFKLHHLNRNENIIPVVKVTAIVDDDSSENPERRS